MPGKVGAQGANGAGTWPVLGGPKTPHNQMSLATLKKELNLIKEKNTLLEKLVAKGGGKGSGTRASGWNCSCGFHNYAFRTTCKACAKARGNSSPGTAAANNKAGGGGATPPPKSQAETDHEREVSAARAMLTSAKGLQDSPQKEQLVTLWEEELRLLKEKERKTLPVGQQLKSALDRVSAKKKASSAAAEAVEDLTAKLRKAEAEATDAKASLEAEENELLRLQQEAARVGGENLMEVDLTGQDANRSAEVTALQSKMGAVLDLLRKLVPVAPADMRDELEGLLTPPAPAEAVQQVNPPAAQPSIAPAPGTGDTDAEGYTAVKSRTTSSAAKGPYSATGSSLKTKPLEA